MQNKETDISQTADMTGKEIASQVSKRSKTGLRPCPFCGSISLSLITFATNLPLTVECNDCGATGPNDRDDRDNPDREKRLRILWDTRREAV